MNDEILKNMWSKAEERSKDSGYERQRIEQFISGRSNSIFRKLKNMIQLDIGLKLLITLVFIIDALLYFTSWQVLVLSLTGAVCLVPLILFEIKTLQLLRQVADAARSTKKQLADVLTFLRTRFFAALLSMASTYVFVFVSGMLLYFYITYGMVRPLDFQDILVFSLFIIIGITMNYVVNRSQVNYHSRHIEVCLSDLNDQVLELVSQNIELQQKQDRLLKLFLFFAVIVGFVLLIAVLKGTGI